MSAEPSPAADPHYRVLARKYRPATFAQLIGQEAMVRTLTNAIRGGRLAHAFILTGVRGVGKTTTARIIARALNCIGADGAGGPTAEPCGICEHCRAIAEDRHMDVIEMDAASRTGVDDIRDLIDGVRYRPVSARYKVYIVDEVHMLSRNAFNALLKTLEEPPAHVKFIFATTEIRKVPVTVLSRCQRFDLRRVEEERLRDHFSGIAGQEGVRIEPAAAALIARAADGSVRDGLSLLDQAMAQAAKPDGSEVTEAAVRDMLGLADGSQAFELLELALRGEAASALDLFQRLYAAGADPALVVQDLLERVHWITRVKLAPAAAEEPTVSEQERRRGKDMAALLTVPALARAWQLLLKGLAEVQVAPRPAEAAEMVLVRLAHLSDLPTPAELVRRAEAGPGAPPAANSTTGREPAANSTTGREPAANSTTGREPSSRPSAGMTGGTATTGGRAATAIAQVAVPRPAAPESDPVTLSAPAPVAAADIEVAASPESFAEVAELFARRREAILHAHIRNNLHLVRFEPGRIEVRPSEHAPTNLANRMGEMLTRWTGRRWVVAVSQAEGEPTLTRQASAAEEQRRSEVEGHPLVQAVMELFPGATIETIHDVAAAADPAPEADPSNGDDDNGDEPR